jgi:hypothetical protein
MPPFVASLRVACSPFVRHRFRVVSLTRPRCGPFLLPNNRRSVAHEILRDLPSRTGEVTVGVVRIPECIWRGVLIVGVFAHLLPFYQQSDGLFPSTPPTLLYESLFGFSSAIAGGGGFDHRRCQVSCHDTVSFYEDGHQDHNASRCKHIHPDSCLQTLTAGS